MTGVPSRGRSLSAVRRPPCTPGVLEQQNRVGDLVLEPRRVHPALLVPRLLVLDGVRSEPHAHEPQLTHGKRLPGA